MKKMLVVLFLLIVSATVAIAGVASNSLDTLAVGKVYSGGTSKSNEVNGVRVNVFCNNPQDQDSAVLSYTGVRGTYYARFPAGTCGYGSLVFACVHGTGVCSDTVMVTQTNTWNTLNTVRIPNLFI